MARRQKAYKAILFAPDGDYVTDHEGHSIEEVERKLADQGSRWIFYPFAAVIRDNGKLSMRQRLLVAWDELEPFVGRTIGTVRRCLEEYDAKRGVEPTG